MRQFQVQRDDPTILRLVDRVHSPLGENDIRLCIDSFALTQNNITYATMGDGDFGYWDFFPAGDGWGNPPCWGFATITSSNVEGIEAGARLYGFFPIASQVDLTPARVRDESFFDGAPHRREKAAVYNQYFFTHADGVYLADREAEQALFRPLYATGWWLRDLVDTWEPQPRTVILTSASSKTSLSTAYELRKRGASIVVAITSQHHLGYLRGLELFDEVRSYAEVEGLQLDGPAAYLDFLGDEGVTARIHRALGTALSHSVVVGSTAWDAKSGGIRLPRVAPDGPAPEFFFAPSYAANRMVSAGPALRARAAADMTAFYAASNSFVTPIRLFGAEAIALSWRRLLAGEVPPSDGLILSW